MPTPRSQIDQRTENIADAGDHDEQRRQYFRRISATSPASDCAGRIVAATKRGEEAGMGCEGGHVALVSTSACWAFQMATVGFWAFMIMLPGWTQALRAVEISNIYDTI